MTGALQLPFWYDYGVGEYNYVYFFRAILKTVMKKCRAAVADREATKSELVRCVAKLRTAFRQLAQKLVNEGRLPHKNLIFHFTRGEIEKLLQEPQPNLVAKYKTTINKITN